MIKMYRIKNRIICVVISILLSVNCFCAVVSDNDGSAFITKAEFDSLKNNFQSELDSYNSAIDSKIDSAIASYLAGISVSKTTSKEPYISNYNEIMWQPNYKVYGKWKKWTNRTTKTESSSNVWFTPALAEKRLSWRSNGWRVWDIMEMAMGELVMGFVGEITSMSNGLAEGVGGYASWSGHAQTCPTLVLSLKKDDATNIWYMPNEDSLLTNMNVLTNETYSNPHTVDKISGIWLYEWGFHNNPVRLNAAPVFSTPDSGQYLKYKYKVTQSDGSSNLSEYQSIMSKNNTTFPFVWSQSSCFNDAGYAASSNASVTSSADRCDSTFFTTGCTWHYLDSGSKTSQLDLLCNMQLGTNYDQDVNIAKQISSKSEGKGYDMSESTQFATASGNFSKECITQPSYIYPAGDGGWTYSVNFSIKVPHWPTQKLRQQTSNKFIYDGTPLKLGQGLPLFIKSNQKGDVQVTFDYNINYALNSTDYTSSQYLYLDLKKGDFLDKSTATSQFYEAYNDIVESSKTTQPKYRYMNYVYPAQTGKIKMTIPIEKGESIWLRIRPSNDSGGYYAKMKNLDVKFVTE